MSNDQYPQQIASQRKTPLAVWYRLLEPPASIQEAGARRQARLSSGLLLIFTALIGAGAVASLLVGSQSGFVLSGTAVVSAVAYVLSRAGRYTLGSILALGAINLAAFATVLLDPTDIVRTLLSFTTVVFILGGALLSIRGVAVLTALNVGGTLLLSVLIPGTPFAEVMSAAGMVATLGGLVLVTGRHRNLIERERVDEVNATSRELQALRSSVEHRIADMTLASDIGRHISQVRDLDVLLANSAELVRSRFDLYYTQIYLVDTAWHTLVLRAGTGDVGLELLRRAHRLPIDAGSINGRAATEKRAIIVADTRRSSTFKPNPLLPGTRSEMAVPLIAGGRVVGVLDLQSSTPGALSEENLLAFETLAAQLAIAIDNARLFAEAEEARTEVEHQASRLTREGWQTFLDAVNRSERLGYTFDRQTLTPLTGPLPRAPGASTLDVPVTVAGEPIGRIQLERDASLGEAWSEEDAGLVAAIAARAATQIENLRQQAQAEQYRAEAEAMARRLTHEGWDDFLRSRTAPVAGYTYDSVRVTPLSTASNGDEPAEFSLPLQVQNEAVGKVAIEGAEHLDPEIEKALAEIVHQLGSHIENLRLTEQIEVRARREQLLSEITARVHKAVDGDAVMRTAVQELGRALGRRAFIYLGADDRAQHSRPESIPASGATTPRGNLLDDDTRELSL